MRGYLVEYALAIPPLALAFDFNPQSMRRTRTITVTTSQSPATRGGYDFALPTESARAAQGVSVEPERFTLSILLDGTDRMNEGEPIATMFGIQPEIDTLRSMVEPKAQGPSGVQLLASLGLGAPGALSTREFASVIIFVWGVRILPVFLTSVEIEEQAHLPTLFPYRAEATLSMQVIESSNPFYDLETLRQVLGSATNTARLGAEAITGLF
ncbi:hypothetical protein NKH48_17540 [Mesorhizobium sp. M1233]|uniref:hypothetical protein n=1 Tax=unclassified Mesorhizobium TaxID=325217 RepID=UPI003338C2A5